jgi:hypothetical protein
MFHTDVLASSGKTIDIDRASFLMDDELFAEARRAMWKEQTTPHWIPNTGPQWVWNDYT